jgi:gas vesicle protein
MPRKDTTEFLAAFAVGTVLGIGATLLLRPERTPRERLARQMKPHGRKLRRSASQIRGAAREGRDAAGDFTGELVEAGKELLGEFRKEVAQILADARDEVSGMARDRADGARKAARRASRKLGL